ncbi:Stealth CR1 domain-containing protein [Solitalea sp. MAHUQ-68]|uniref:Capsular polysaccharide phosphotransferase SacB n=1 Tax=Solitalea agri TaxID=2953739 RepID=A0A9X2JEX9_9SPHI|nr:Stealth CR1 domain-containing protein [Solitalea agri]MCO4292871.1 Stealth CR1 domain-containing protein [Solitalea agri]
MGKQNLEIDLIYLWVDGNDPQWMAKKIAITGKSNDNSETNNKGRYFNNDELKYSLRSAEQNVPWIRQIYIVTDNQKPEWLNTDHPKIKVIDHKDILPPEALPCFNSSVIEYFLYKIPGLSEHFLFSNDDMFFNHKLSPDFFFTKEGLPIVRLKKKLFGRWHNDVKMAVGKELGHYARMLMDSAVLVNEKFGKYYSGVPHHNIDAYRKSDYKEAVESVFIEQVKKSQGNHVRTFGDLHRSAFSYYVLAIGHAVVKYVKRKESSRILVSRHNFKKYIESYHPKLFCLNDDQKVSDKNREAVKPFLETHFPVKSAFEK